MKTMVLSFIGKYFEWHILHELRIRAILTFLMTKIFAVLGVASDLLQQTDLDQDVCNRYVDLSFKR